MIKKYLKAVRDSSGLTLVELIVTFALIGMFMTAATFVLSNSLRMFQRMESTSKAVTVSDLLLDKISGEIAAADVDTKDVRGEYYFWLGGGADDPESTGASWVAFCNRSKSPISIYESGGRLIIKYYAVTDEDKVGESVKPVKEIDWKFDDNVYMGFKIKSLTFSRPQPNSHPNVICIDLVLENERSGFVYSTYRYAGNYNYDGISTGITIRNDGKNELPSEAVEFAIKTDEGNGGTEPTEPTTPVEPPEPTTPEESPEEPPEPVKVSFKVISRAKQDDGSYLRLKESLYEEEIGNQFVLTPEDKLVYDGKTYKCLSTELSFMIGTNTAAEYYVEYEMLNEDEYFQRIIPLDANGWWRTPDIPMNNENGERQHIVNPGGIAKWEASSSDSYYYVVIKQVAGNGWSTQTPKSVNETSVIIIPDLEILSFEELAPTLESWQGSAFHARVFSYKGNYYVRLGYNNPLGSPEEQPSEWYKIP